MLVARTTPKYFNKLVGNGGIQVGVSRANTLDIQTHGTFQFGHQPTMV
jgi:hypothetical protein